MALHNLNEALAELETLAIKTERGVFFRAEDVHRLLAEKRVEKAEEAEKPRPKTMADARAAVMGNEELVKSFSTPEKQQSALRAAVA
jgi:hypothetical protein